MTDTENSDSGCAARIKEYLNSGICRVYLLVTLTSIVAIAVATGSLGVGLFIGGWIGVFAAIAVNEFTDGYTMEDSWIARREI